MSTRLIRFLVIAVGCGAMLISTGCAGHHVPNHGGGKRFYWEQKVLDEATVRALDTMNLTGLPSKSVRLAIHVIGHEGGATSTSTPGMMDLSAFGSLSGGSRGAAGAASSSIQSAGGFDAQSFAYANSSDTQYLRGALILKLGSAGISVCDAESTCDGTLHVLVTTFGIDRWSRGFMFYRRDRLDAAVAMRAMFVDNSGACSPVPSGAGTARYREGHFFGITIDKPGLYTEPE